MYKVMEWYTDGCDLYPVDNSNSVPVVLSSSEEYLPYTCVTIHSLLRNGSPEYFYDIILLHYDKFNLESIEMINKIIIKWQNCSLRFLKINNNKYYINGHISNETYARLMLPSLLINYDKVIYLDSDLIVRKDISELFYRKVKYDTMVSGVQDFDVIGQYNGREYSMKYYLDCILKIKYPYNYLQAGVLCFYLKSIRRKVGLYKLSEVALESRLRYFDQDVINLVCNKNIEILDCRWNVVTDCDNYRVSNIIKYAPLDMYDMYMSSRKDPWIVHYSGYKKPWNNKYEDMSEYFHHEVKLANLEKNIYIQELDNLISNSLSIKSIIKKIFLRIIPRKSFARELIKTCYFYFNYKVTKG